jgi:hypothetical protein
MTNTYDTKNQDILIRRLNTGNVTDYGEFEHNGNNYDMMLII